MTLTAAPRALTAQLMRARTIRTDTPYVNQLLNGSDGGCMVQHSPYAGDGGAEETAYGWQCLEYFLTAADGGTVLPDLDLVYFNWGLHNLVAPGGRVVPGQSGYSTDYLHFLTKIATRLAQAAKQYGFKLLFGLTSPEMCDAATDAVVVGLNAQAKALMISLDIPTVDLHAAVVGKCGAPPQTECLGEKGGGCPHYSPAGYTWIANSTLAPAFRQLLAEGPSADS